MTQLLLRKLNVLYLNTGGLVIIIKLKGKTLETCTYRFNTALLILNCFINFFSNRHTKDQFNNLNETR